MKANLMQIIEQVERLRAYTERAIQGEPIIWTNTSTGERRTNSDKENLAYIADELMAVAFELDILKQNIQEISVISPINQAESRENN